LLLDYHPERGCRVEGSISAQQFDGGISAKVREIGIEEKRNSNKFGHYLASFGNFALDDRASASGFVFAFLIFETTVPPEILRAALRTTARDACNGFVSAVSRARVFETSGICSIIWLRLVKSH
jgi:hypothetical protein